MAAGGHFEKKSQKKLRIDLKWREMRSKVIFDHPKCTPAAILWKTFKKIKVAYWFGMREMRSKVTFDHPKWTPAAILWKQKLKKVVYLLLCEKFWKNFAKYIGHRGLSVCLSVCLSACLSVCLSVFKGSTGRAECPIVLIFFPEDVLWTRDNAELFFWKIGWRARSGSPLLWKSDMGHNFWTGSDRDFGLDAKRSLYNSASVRYPPFWRTPSRFYVTWL